MKAQEALETLARLPIRGSSVSELMDRVAHLTRDVLAGADEVSITLVQEDGPATVAATGELALALDARQYAMGRGPCVDSIAAAEAVRIRSTRAEDRWLDWVSCAAASGCRSVMSVPVPLQREVQASLNIYSTAEDAFDDEALAMATTFSAYAGALLANVQFTQEQARVVEQLQTAMRSRAVIEQAKGLIMGERRCTAEEAFDVLITLSQNSNRKLRDVAQGLVDEAGGWVARREAG